MRDELDGRLWAAHHEEFSSGLDRLAGKAMDVFRLLNRHYWAAPWDNKEGAKVRPQIFAVSAALLVSFLVITGTVTPAEVQAQLNTPNTSSSAYYLA